MDFRQVICPQSWEGALEVATQPVSLTLAPPSSAKRSRFQNHVVLSLRPAGSSLRTAHDGSFGHQENAI